MRKIEFLIEDVIDGVSSLKGYSSVKIIENGYSPDKNTWLPLEKQILYTSIRLEIR